MHQIIHVSLNKVETRTSSRQSEPDFLNCSIKTVKHVINDAPFDFYWFVGPTCLLGYNESSIQDNR